MIEGLYTHHSVDLLNGPLFLQTLTTASRSYFVLTNLLLNSLLGKLFIFVSMTP